MLTVRDHQKGVCRVGRTANQVSRAWITSFTVNVQELRENQHGLACEYMTTAHA